ncbi:hypothetical protein OH76DRAFT_1316067, partial [Lentinus brumalis]
AFLDVADRRFGPITTIRRDGKIVKKIPWSAFRLDDDDWERVKLCTELLDDATRYLHAFFKDGVPTLHRSIPALEALLTRWEKRRADPKYALFHPALDKGLEKLRKYYLNLDNTDAYILAQFTQPYYRLDYIEQKWGGEQEQRAEIAAGDPDAVNWTAYARTVVENAMKAYWPKRLTLNSANQTANAGAGSSARTQDDDDDDFDRARRRRLAATNEDNGWQDEL